MKRLRSAIHGICLPTSSKAASSNVPTDTSVSSVRGKKLSTIDQQAAEEEKKEGGTPIENGDDDLVPELSSTGAPKQQRSNHPQSDSVVDPFRVGYNMGMQNVQLETLRNKLDDNRELLKSQLTALREVSRSNHDSQRRLQGEYTKQLTSDIIDNNEKLVAKFEAFNQRLSSNEETMRELTRQQFESLQKHTDDRLENMKDTVKVGVALILILNVCCLYSIVNQKDHHHGTKHEAHRATFATDTPAQQEKKK